MDTKSRLENIIGHDQTCPKYMLQGISELVTCICGTDAKVEKILQMVEKIRTQTIQEAFKKCIHGGRKGYCRKCKENKTIALRRLNNQRKRKK